MLGLDRDASTQQILKAFRHWIKQHHPDHAQGPHEMQAATEHARKLNEAKQTLLSRRKHNGKAA